MNYFSHFFLDHYPNNTPFNVGLILPDITRGQVKTFKPIKTALNNYQNEIIKGCHTHYAADKKFHASTLFDDLVKSASLHLNQAEFKEPVNRKWFMAHIMAELMLDRLLIETHQPLLDSFYSHLATVDSDELAIVLQTYEIADNKRFFDFFDHFRTVQYLYHYIDNNKFVYSLNRILMKAGIPSLSDYNQTCWLKSVISYHHELKPQTSVLIERLLGLKNA